MFNWEHDIVRFMKGCSMLIMGELNAKLLMLCLRTFCSLDGGW